MLLSAISYCSKISQRTENYLINSLCCGFQLQLLEVFLGCVCVDDITHIRTSHTTMCLIVFTALHCMQRGPSHRNGVRLSVRLSVTA